MRSNLSRFPTPLLFASILAVAACGPETADPPADSVSHAGAATDLALSWFEERAAEAGIDFVYESGFDRRHLFPEIMGGGVALADLDGDDHLDIYLVQGGDLTRDRPDAARNRLFLNDGTGRFRDISAESGADDPGYGMGVTTGDYDRDGDVDLYVTNYGPNTLLRNEGNGRFVDVTDSSGVGLDSWSTGTAFVDVDRDGLLDLFVVNYVRWTPAGEIECYSAAGIETYCSPNSYDSPAPDVLYLNRGGGLFEDVSHEFGLGRAFGNGLGVVTADFDGNGFTDIFVANDQTPNQLWSNQGGTRLVDVAVSAGCAVSQMGKARAGMGVEAADIDGDLDPDLLIVNLQAQSDSFFRNEGDYFVEDTASVGLALASRPYTRFGVGAADFDNDGRLDLYQANGRVTLPEVLPAGGGDPYAEVNLLYRGVEGGRFEPIVGEVDSATNLIHTSRGTAFGDLDNDGGIDIVVVNRDASAYVLANRNRGEGNWIGFRVVGAAGSHALGAQVFLRSPERLLRRDVRSASSYLAANDPRVHFGLGSEARIVDVEVAWPDGQRQSFGPQPINRYTALRRD